MENFFRENQGTASYLVYETDQMETLDTVSLGMLTHNQIPHIVGATTTQMNNVKYIRYNITAKVSLNQYLKEVMTRQNLISIFKGICDAYQAAEEYMIVPNTLLLDEENLFIDESKAEVEMICIPVVKEIGEIEFRKFFKNILVSVQFDSSQDGGYVTEILNYLNRNTAFDMSEFRALVESLGTGTSVRADHSASGYPKEADPAQISKGISGEPESDSHSLWRTSNGSDYPSQPTVPRESVSQEGHPDKPCQEHEESNHSEEQGKKKKTFFDFKGGKEKGKKGKKEKAKSKGTADSERSALGANKEAGEFEIPGHIPSINPNVNREAPVPPNKEDNAPAENPAGTPMNYMQEGEHKKHDVVMGETVVLAVPGIGATTVLRVGETQPKPSLIRKRTNEVVMIDKPVFRIGKLKSDVDYFIGDNTAISRSHADIVTRDGRYYIIDMDSTNHTYVNGMLIPSKKEISIASGTKIRLADEDFEFVLA